MRISRPHEGLEPTDTRSSAAGASPSRRALMGGMAASAVAGSARAADYPVVGKVERLDPALDALIDADAKVEKVLDGFIWCEGPVWVGGADGFVLASDVRANVIRRWNEKDGGSEWLKPSGWAGPPDPGLSEAGTNGLCLGRGGIVYADSGTRTVGVIDLKTRRKTVLCSHFEGKRFNSPNDVVLRSDGTIYFTDPPFGLKGAFSSPLREMDYTGVFRIGTDNVVTLVERYAGPNGIGLSPDGRTLYLSDRFASRADNGGWVAWSLDAAGYPVQKRTFIDRASSPGGGDGLRVDSQGNIWASGPSGLNVFTPQGKRIGAIHADDVISNCEFGADGYLYMTSNHRLIRVRAKAKKLLWPVWKKA